MKFSMLNHLALVISLILSGQTYALEMLEDDSLSDVTGEGVAFLPEDFSFRFNGPDVANGGKGTFDTGYIRYIPVGPLTAAATSDPIYGATTGKGDIFLYGAAISKSDGDFNKRFNDAILPAVDAGQIKSWGTSANPWLFKTVTTPLPIPDFDASTPASATKGSVTYLALEAPLYEVALPATRAAGLDAYKLKLAYWLDAFVRNPSVAEDMTATGTQFDVVAVGRANRLRYQAIWDGVSMNGSQIQVFQTLGGAATLGGSAANTAAYYGTDPLFYNNTLGLAGVLRFNSGDSSGLGLRATHSFTAGGRTEESYTQTWDGNRFRNVAGPDNYTDTSGSAGGAASAGCDASTNAHRAAGSSCLFRFQTRAVIDSASSSSWTAPALTALRFSTRETADTNLLATPAIGASGATAPNFDPSEGVFAYNANVNLVLGQLYQPLVVGVAPDGKNLVMELTRIPNKVITYKEIYTDYSGLDATYKGSTCNVHSCGTTRNLGGVNYQGNTATHSSITIGSTVYDSAKNELTAYKGIEAVGVSFGALPVVTQTYSTAAQSYRDVQVATRTAGNSFACGPIGYAFCGWSGFTNLTAGNSARYNLAAYSPNTWTQQTPLAQPAFATRMSSVPSNNLGSAVIDGFLVQHLKITTKGL